MIRKERVLTEVFGLAVPDLQVVHGELEVVVDEAATHLVQGLRREELQLHTVGLQGERVLGLCVRGDGLLLR